MATGLAAYDLPFDSTESRILDLVKEALELRHGAALDPEGKIVVPPYEAGNPAARTVLIRVRQRLDRLEELSSTARQLHGRVSRARAAAAFEADTAWNRAARENASTARQYSSAAERAAESSLDSFEEKRRAHQAERLVSTTQESLDVIKDCLWGMRNIREELLTAIRSENWIESTIERG
jgi:hypothetical protein